MGSNEFGSLGISNNKIKFSPSPCLVETLINTPCIKVACGGGHSIAIMETGEAYSWGKGLYGALG